MFLRLRARRLRVILFTDVTLRRNVGISVMREDRELMTLPVLNAIGDPRNRWWGCEIKFTQDCDDLFGVDHSKQLAARLQAVHRSCAESYVPRTKIAQWRAKKSRVLVAERDERRRYPLRLDQKN